MPTYTDYVDKVQQQYANSSTTDNIKPDKYVIKSHTYPSDLGSQDLQHYVLFNINVRGKSSINSGGKLEQVTRAESSGGMTSEQLGTSTIVGAAAVGAVAGFSATSALNKAPARAPGAPTQTRGQAFAQKAGEFAVNAAGGVVGGAVAAAFIATNNLLKPDTTHRISDAIALYVDGPPTVKYNMNYATKDLGNLMGLLSGSVFDQGGMAAAGEAAAAVATAMAKIPGAFGAADLQAAISKASGTALNPFKEVVFESVDFRSFNFKYKFFPKNAGESQAVQNIITLFKIHMHPELSAGRLFFIAPSEFQITYYFNSAPNRYFHKFRPCALESMDISYGADQFTAFKNGNPTEINMTLAFRELEILTRASIKEGY